MHEIIILYVHCTLYIMGNIVLIFISPSNSDHSYAILKVFWIWIRIRKFLGLLDPEPDPLVGGTDHGSGSFHHQPKIVIKTFISTVFWLLCDFVSLKNYVNVHSKSKKLENQGKNIFVGVLKVIDERAGSRAGSGSVSQRYGSADLNP